MLSSPTLGAGDTRGVVDHAWIRMSWDRPHIWSLMEEILVKFWREISCCGLYALLGCHNLDLLSFAM